MHRFRVVPPPPPQMAASQAQPSPDRLGAEARRLGLEGGPNHEENLLGAGDSIEKQRRIKERSKGSVEGSLEECSIA